MLHKFDNLLVQDVDIDLSKVRRINIVIKCKTCKESWGFTQEIPVESIYLLSLAPSIQRRESFYDIFKKHLIKRATEFCQFNSDPNNEDAQQCTGVVNDNPNQET